MSYIPLGIKTDYSLLQSIVKIDNLIDYSLQHNINTIGILDNNLFASAEFYFKCQKSKLKPIIGLSIKINNFSLYLYAQNYEGLKNLFLIHDIIFEREVNYNDLNLYNQNIILVLPFNSYSLFNDLKNKFKEIFLSYQNDQEKTNALIITPKIVFINEIYLIDKNDNYLINYLKMIENNETIETFQMHNYSNNCLSKEEISKFDQDKTIEFSQLINLDWPSNKNNLPHFQTNTKDNYKFLTQLSIKGLKKRLNNQIDDIYKERLLSELETIKEMGFINYFLIVYDYVLYAKKNNILVGPGRGSAAGSLVSYSLGITNVDPIKYNLLFERFLNKERITMPDIDIDFEDTKRDEIKKYLINKYGNEHVASIITFSSLGSKQVLRDLFEIFNYQDTNANILLKEIDANANLKTNLNNDSVKKIIENNDLLKKIYQIGIKLEGIKKLISTHAAGIVLSQEKLSSLIPMYKTTNNYLTGITMDYLEPLGLLKMDLLSLNNLTIIHKCLDLLKDKFDLNNIDLNDQKTYELFSQGNTSSVFQFESTGMKNFLRKLKPNKFSDLYAAVALFRPGPMENIDLFISRKNGLSKIDYIHPDLENILSETYGIIVYQEQIIQILTKMAGYSLAESDLIRKSMSKKDYSLLAHEKEKFILGCQNNHYSLEISNKVFDLILKFALYGFNKSHSVSYALISYQLAYLKTNYPVEFITTLLNMNIGSVNKIKEYILTAHELGVKIIDFDLNKSKKEFYISNNEIYLPLVLIKGINEKDQEKIDLILKEKINDIFDFINLAINQGLEKEKIISLIKVGVLDYFGYNRQTLLSNLDKIINYGELLDTLDNSLVNKPLIEIEPEMPISILLANEIDLCGFYISNHPTNEYFKKEMIKVNQTKEHFDKIIETVIIIERIKKIKTKKNEDMAFITGSDETGSMEFILFSKNIDLLEKIKENNVIIIKGKVTKKNDKYGIIINKIKNTGE